jgi:hypothetical protein
MRSGFSLALLPYYMRFIKGWIKADLSILSLRLSIIYSVYFLTAMLEDAKLEASA